MAPVIPAVSTSIHLAATGLRDASSSIERELFSQFIERVLSLAKPADGLVMMTVTALQQLNTAPSLPVASRGLKAAAIQALENGDRLGLREVWDEFARRMFDEEMHLIQVVAQDSAEVAATANWLDYSRARYCWRQFWSKSEPPDGAPIAASRFLLAAEIGSAALAAGVMSVAVEIALALRDARVTFDGLRERLLEAEMKARFTAWSEWGGGFLGQRPEDTLNDFMEFAENVASSVGS